MTTRVRVCVPHRLLLGVEVVVVLVVLAGKMIQVVVYPVWVIV